MCKNKTIMKTILRLLLTLSIFIGVTVCVPVDVYSQAEIPKIYDVQGKMINDAYDYLLHTAKLSSDKIVALTLDEAENQITSAYSSRWRVQYEEMRDDTLYLYCMFEIYGVLGCDVNMALDNLEGAGYKKIELVSCDPKKKKVWQKAAWKVCAITENMGTITLYCKHDEEGFVKNAIQSINATLNGSVVGDGIEIAARGLGRKEIVAQIDEYKEAYELFKENKQKWIAGKIKTTDWMRTADKAEELYTTIKNTDVSEWKLVEKAYLYKIGFGILNDILEGEK